MADRKVYLEARVRVIAWVDQGVDSMEDVAKTALGKIDGTNLGRKLMQVEDVELLGVEVEDSK